MLLIIICLVINIILSNIIGKLGKEKKIGFNTAFCVSFFLSPIIGVLIVIASTPLTKEDREVTLPPDVSKITAEEMKKYDSVSLIIGLIIFILICYMIF